MNSTFLGSWWNKNIFFVSIHKHWKGIYLHCLSNKWCYRLFLWGYDKHRKSLVNQRGN